jgi:hypothetical protein
VTVLAGAVRLRDLGEREGLRDREREAPGLISSPIPASGLAVPITRAPRTTAS